ncbi:DUF362 domain-containing protein [Sporolituus thermophilus]|uniref:4Fe-4S dicluster domain-containing protein n=1 Tax=Sporolituus thermophilus DSM 23256 TaxID=1123285 RepID=A0A1G7JAC7_9FIRM|nr:4Fe-4S dicluster domain-containing protein [Sporolituus thermophilus]SDF21922.1 4Fe-4S dicluster domain-containing protein [Sporolituus thermophilus DSM 23256]
MEKIRYFITKNCKKCDACLEHCPEGAVSDGKDGNIVNDNCTGCAECEAMCPNGAIVRETDPYRTINREMDSFFGGGAWPLGDRKR